MKPFTLIDKRCLAIALFEEITGEPVLRDWSHITEAQLDALIGSFGRIIEGDQDEIAHVLTIALRTLQC